MSPKHGNPSRRYRCTAKLRCATAVDTGRRIEGGKMRAELPSAVSVVRSQLSVGEDCMRVWTPLDRPLEPEPLAEANVCAPPHPAFGHPLPVGAREGKRRARNTSPPSPRRGEGGRRPGERARKRSPPPKA